MVTPARAQPCSGTPTATAPARPPPYRKAMSSVLQTSASSAGTPPTMTAAASDLFPWTRTRSPFWGPPRRPSRSVNPQLLRTTQPHANPWPWHTTRRWRWVRNCLPATLPTRLHPSSVSRRSPPRVPPARARARPCSVTPMATAPARPPPYRKAMSSARQTSASSAGIPPTTTVAASALFPWMPTRSPFWVPPHRPSRSANLRRLRTTLPPVNRCRSHTTRR